MAKAGSKAAAEITQLYPEEIAEVVERLEQLITELEDRSEMTAFLLSIARMQLIEEAILQEPTGDASC